MKKNYWVGRNRSGNTIEIKIKDDSEALLDWWEINIKDKIAATKVINILKRKYGFSFEIPIEKSINAKDEEDLGWLLGNE